MRTERKKHRRNSSEDTSSEDISKRRRHYNIKPKEPNIYTAKNIRKQSLLICYKGWEWCSGSITPREGFNAISR
jgi:hypothetical protein